jgi:anaerobic selenocysteine-containing dehydrogenase
MTIRSHDQFNTTIYGLNDRYRGIKDERRVLFLHADDIQHLGFQPSGMVDIISVAEDGIERRAEKFKIISYDIPRGCAAAYFPETNVLVPLHSVADRSHTPTSKYILVRLQRAGD